MTRSERDTSSPWADPAPSYSVGPVRYDNYVPAARRVELPALESAPMDVSGVWAPAARVEEVGTPVSRALATVIRAAPLLVLALPASIAWAWWLDARLWQWALIWAGLSVIAYLGVLWIDLLFNSPSAAERHRVTTAAGLKRLEMRHAQELRRAIVESYLEHLERH